MPPTSLVAQPSPYTPLPALSRAVVAMPLVPLVPVTVITLEPMASGMPPSDQFRPANPVPEAPFSVLVQTSRPDTLSPTPSRV